jgi:hypothetical protein
MASDPEALTQLARLLQNDRLRAASIDEAQAAIDEKMPLLASGLLEEAAASDDVLDRESALEFIRSRLAYFGTLVRDDQRALLLDDIRSRIEAW